MSNHRSKTQLLCRVAAMAAIYFLLKKFFGIEVGTLKINFATLPVVLAALLFGPLEAGVVAAIGEFLYQILGYGITATTALYVLTPAIRGAVIGVAARVLAREGRHLEARPVACYIVCVAAALLTTVCNTAVNALDSIIYGYYSYAYVFGNLAVRLTSGVIVAVVIATLAMPIAVLLRRQGFARKD